MARERDQRHDPRRFRQPGVAYLLSVVGTATSRLWQQRIGDIDLDPREGVVLRMVASEPGRSQRSLGPALHVRPSHIVAVIDRLEEGGLIERRSNPRDRRAHALHLTRRGRAALARLMDLSETVEAEVVEGLTAAERRELERLLALIARRQGLAPGGHPGFDDGPD